MDFLTTALYELDGNGEEQLAGALITRFDPDDLVSRAKVIYVTTEQMRTGKGINPSGFKLDKEGVLLSDTPCRREMNKYLADYVSNEVQTQVVSGEPDLIDVVMHGAKADALIVVDAEDASKPITIAMSSLRVSSSSFNIYAPYQKSDESFRTFSLIDIETDKSVSFNMAVPSAELGSFDGLRQLMTPCADIEGLPEYKIFTVDAPFNPFYTFTGEAFCNYLAYNVGYCNIGLQVFDSFFADTKCVHSKKAEQSETRVPKKPLHNVSIHCTCDEAKLEAVLDAMGDIERLKTLSEDQEFYATFVWLQDIFKASEQFEGTDVEDKLAAACVSLQRECRERLLHYSLELLAQRYYICKLGPNDDLIGPVLKGGGVNGCSIKRVTW